MRSDRMQVEELHLDPRNPRLPEGLARDEHSIATFLRNEEALEELAQSFVDNGFFESDPLIVVTEDDGLTNVVVEGNRRLATLKILLGLIEDERLAFNSIAATPEQLDRLRVVACFVVEDRDQELVHVASIRA